MFSLNAPKNAAAAPATSTSRLDLHPVAHIADCHRRFLLAGDQPAD